MSKYSDKVISDTICLWRNGLCDKAQVEHVCVPLVKAAAHMYAKGTNTIAQEHYTDAYLALLVSLKHWDASVKFSTYYIGFAFRYIRNIFRDDATKWRNGLLAQAYKERTKRSYINGVDVQDLCQAIRKNLNEREQQLTDKCVIGEMTQANAGKEHGISKAYVGVILRRAFKRLRNRYVDALHAIDV